MDIPLSWLSGHPLRRRGALHRTPQVYQLFLPRVRLPAAPEHAVQSGLCALQDEAAAGQAEVFPVYIEWCCVVRGFIDGLCNDERYWTGGIVFKWAGFGS